MKAHSNRDFWGFKFDKVAYTNTKNFLRVFQKEKSWASKYTSIDESDIKTISEGIESWKPVLKANPFNTLCLSDVHPFNFIITKGKAICKIDHEDSYLSPAHDITCFCHDVLKFDKVPILRKSKEELDHKTYESYSLWFVKAFLRKYSQKPRYAAAHDDRILKTLPFYFVSRNIILAGWLYGHKKEKALPEGFLAWALHVLENCPPEKAPETWDEAFDFFKKFQIPKSSDSA